MAVLGILSIFLIFFSIVALTVSGKNIYLSILLWVTPIFEIVFNLESDKQINGLVVVIGLMYTGLTIYSTHNIRLWNTSDRNKTSLFMIISYTINTVISLYFSVQSYILGYMPFSNLFSEFGIYIFFFWCIYTSICSSIVFINAVDKYFSKKTKFVLIKCSPNFDVNFLKIRKKGIKGIKNGKIYTLYTTNKAYWLLKREKSLVMNINLGVLGGIYCSGKELFSGKIRQEKRFNRTLIKRGIFSFFASLVIILFFYRILLGMNFETIFIHFMSAILK